MSAHVHDRYPVVRLPRLRPFPVESFLRCGGCGHRIARLTTAYAELIAADEPIPAGLSDRPVIDLSKDAIVQTRSRPPWMWPVEVVNRYRAIFRAALQQNPPTDQMRQEPPDPRTPDKLQEDPPPDPRVFGTGHGWTLPQHQPRSGGFRPPFGWFGTDGEGRFPDDPAFDERWR